jgi:hypothetical protein
VRRLDSFVRDAASGDAERLGWSGEQGEARSGEARRRLSLGLAGKHGRERENG